MHEFERFWAIGSGKAYALGAMVAVYDRLDDPTEIAKLGILAACEFDNACDLPIAVYSLRIKEDRSTNGVRANRKMKVAT